MPPQRRHHHKHHRNGSGVSRMQAAGSSSSASESPYPIMQEAVVHSGQHHLNYTQQQINAALFNMDSPPPLPPAHHVEEIFLEQSRYVKSPRQTPTAEDLAQKALGEIGKSLGDVTQDRATTDAHSTEKSADAMLDSGIGEFVLCHSLIHPQHYISELFSRLSLAYQTHFSSHRLWEIE